MTNLRTVIADLHDRKDKAHFRAKDHADALDQTIQESAETIRCIAWLDAPINAEALREALAAWATLNASIWAFDQIVVACKDDQYRTWTDDRQRFSELQNEARECALRLKGWFHLGD